MRVEGGLAGRKLSELPELGSTEKTKRALSKKKRKRQRKSSSMHTGVQKLFETCREVFSNGGPGIVPQFTDVERLRSVLDGMNPTDVGLNQDMPYFRNPMITRTPTITYLHLYECDKFSIGIFCLPPSAVIPLHNHPGMTVFSKLLFGSMHIKSYDWADVSENADKSINYTHFQPPGVRLAKMNTNDVFNSPCNTSILYPDGGGNMHCFTALTSCAVLDVLGPPYSDPEGRHCAYYCDFPYASFSGDLELREGEGEGCAWLEELEKPEDLFVVRAPYEGPKIVEH